MQKATTLHAKAHRVVLVLAGQRLQLGHVLGVAGAGLLLRRARLGQVRLQRREAVAVQLGLLHLRLQLPAL